MITGFNTDVEYDGKVYHVQTEDKGLGNPVVESLVYTGGEILTSRRSSYEELSDSGCFSEDEVLRRMELQHQQLIRDICNGKFNTEKAKPFGYELISNRSLDEVALDYLLANLDLGQIEIALLDKQVLREATRPTLRLAVCEQESERPIGGATVRVRLITTAGESIELYLGHTDENGLCEATFDLPCRGNEELAVVCEAELYERVAQYRQLVEKAKRSEQRA